jgi:FixJ family two-component response regulator
VVDDDLSFVTIVCAALDRLGVRSDVAFTGADALRYLGHREASGVLLDLRLPDMDGLDVLREVRQRDNLVPVVVLTGAGIVPAAVEAMKLGAVDFVEKPLPLPALTQAVLALHSPTRPPAQPPNRPTC